MKALEMAFAGHWDSRAAEERATSDSLRAGSQVLPLWRGKPQIAQDCLAWVAADSPVLRHAGDSWLFSGPTERATALCRRHLWLGTRRAGQGRFGNVRRPVGTNLSRRSPRRVFCGIALGHDNAICARSGLGGNRARRVQLAPVAPVLRCVWLDQPDRARRLGTPLLKLRRQAFPTHRPGGHHAGHIWQQSCFWAGRMAGQRACIPRLQALSNPERRPRARSPARFWKKPASASGARATLARSHGPFRIRLCWAILPKPKPTRSSLMTNWKTRSGSAGKTCWPSWLASAATQARRAKGLSHIAMIRHWLAGYA